ncbi:MAG: hypothetical protein ACRYFW_06645 [Janthinobacterium lividum]
MSVSGDPTLLDWFTAPRIMGVVAAVLAVATAVVWTRPARGEGAVYARRIAGTMLGAGALVLAMFAWNMSGWGPGR